MKLYNFLFNVWTISSVFFSIKNLINNKKNILLSIINIIIFSTLLSIIFLIKNLFIISILENLIIIIFLIIEFKKYKSLLFSSIYIIYLIRFIFKLLFFMTLKCFNIANDYSLLIYIFSGILKLIFTFTFKDYITSLINKSDDKYSLIKNLLNLFLTSIIILIQIPNQSILILDSNSFYLLFVLIVFNLSISLFIEKNKTEDYIKNYQKIVEYSEFTEGLLTEYKSFIHEYKNKLIIIKGLVEENNIELHEYINSILNEKVTNNYHWLMDIKNIPIPGIKGLINFKLLKMKDLSINVEVYISEEIASLKNNYLDIKEKNNLYTILGVILDNAIEASLESKEKMISLHFFKDNNDINIILANTFKSINLEELEEKGYSSKGKNRGIGLYLVKEILKKSKILKKETSIINNFFVQKIIIKNIE